MKCQHCQEKEAVIQMNIIVNGNQRRFQLCHDCYQLAKQPVSQFDDLFKQLFNSSSEHTYKQQTTNPTQEKSFLSEHGRNLTFEAKQGRIDGVIGRDDEIERVIQILNRRTKNNPVLIGEAGVGKTAIVEGFALRIAEGKVPAKLRDKQVYTLDLSSLVAGTSYRGQFEEKMQKLVQELQSNQNIILFIDEIHMIVGAGSTSDGSMDAGNILKPALARGDLQVIGATTLKEYRTIEKDQALERRLQPVHVKEPSLEKALEILQGIKPIYEQYHEVTYSDDVLRACVNLSDRYIQDRFLPDKAIDLLDEAGSILNLSERNSDKQQLQERLDTIKKEKAQATVSEQYEKAAQLRDEELELVAKMEQTAQKSASLQVTVEDVQKMIEKKTGIPVRKLQKAEQAKMKDLKERLAAKVIGQEEAVEKVARAIKRSRAGLKPKNRPISFMFVGPTGVGKTELTKRLAEELFGSKEAMIRLDMSEFMEKHSVSKLIGSPPGYVGHDDGGQLTEQVRRNPYSIILLDEIEKAHPDVQHMFLQIMEDRRLTDSTGRIVTFKDTVIIMTSNAGSSIKKIKVGFGEVQAEQKEASVLEALGSYFKPEFLNRLDSIIEFNSLSKDDLIKIVEVMLTDLRENLSEQEITIEFNDAALEKLAEDGFNPQFGARPLRRVIQEKVEDQITDLILDHEELSQIEVTVTAGELQVVQKG